MRIKSHDADLLSILAPSASPSISPGKSTLSAKLARFARGTEPNVRAEPSDRAASAGETATPAGALPGPVQAQMSLGFGTDFSDVRVHEDGQADAMGAAAFASGNDLHFARGAYDPTSESGLMLIAHELTHVVQQREGRVAGEGLVVDQALETEADALGARAARGESVAASSASPIAQGKAKQGSGIKQAALPAVPPAVIGAATWLKGIAASVWAWAGVEATGTAVGTLSALAGAVGGVGQAIQPGQSGVQAYSIQPWHRTGSEEALARLIKVRLLNRFVEMIMEKQPVTGGPAPGPAPVAPAPDAPAPGAPGPGTPAPAPGDPAAAPEGPTIDPALVEMVKAAVTDLITEEVKKEVSSSVKTLVYSEEFTWDDGGIPGVGTRGAIRFKNVRAYRLSQVLRLSPALMAEPIFAGSGLDGSSCDCVGILSGDLILGPSWKVGFNDSLAVNFQSQVDNGTGLDINLIWQWDGGPTYMTLDVSPPNLGGVPMVNEKSRENTPDDFNPL